VSSALATCSISATQRCAGQADQTFTKPVDIAGPTVGAPTDSGCSLDGSNVGSSHREVFVGETFTHYVHVFNDGKESCPDVTVTYTIPDGATFVSCTANCTVSGKTVTWKLGTVNGGESRDVSVTLKVNGGLPNGTKLPGVATVTSGGETKTARTDLPTVTGNSVLEPPHPAGGAASEELPKTGGNGSFLLLGGALVALALATRRYLLGARV
jgi:uncharacterized repeat protein (TIGR01451 family)/LPXTG-motif cell wall-anchored protein